MAAILPMVENLRIETSVKKEKKVSATGTTKKKETDPARIFMSNGRNIHHSHSKVQTEIIRILENCINKKAHLHEIEKELSKAGWSDRSASPALTQLCQQKVVTRHLNSIYELTMD